MIPLALREAEIRLSQSVEEVLEALSKNCYLLRQETFAV